LLKTDCVINTDAHLDAGALPDPDASITADAVAEIPRCPDKNHPGLAQGPSLEFPLQEAAETQQAT